MNSYVALAKGAVERRELIWPLRPKLHALCHVISGVQADCRNPKYFACFLDEDFLGKVVRVAAKCHRTTVCRAVLQRYLVRMARRWQGLENLGVSALRRRCHRLAGRRFAGRPLRPLPPLRP